MDSLIITGTIHGGKVTMNDEGKRLRPRLIIAALVLLPFLYVASAAPMLRWSEGTHGGAVLVRKSQRSWDNWLAVYKPVVWLAQPKNSFLADPLDWWFDVWGVQWGVGGWEAGG